MPLRDYQCRDCGHVWEELIISKEDIPDGCVQCDSLKISPLPGAHGGYKIKGINDSSWTPKSSGSFKRSK